MFKVPESIEFKLSAKHELNFKPLYWLNCFLSSPWLCLLPSLQEPVKEVCLLLLPGLRVMH